MKVFLTKDVAIFGAYIEQTKNVVENDLNSHRVGNPAQRMLLFDRIEQLAAHFIPQNQQEEQLDVLVQPESQPLSADTLKTLCCESVAILLCLRQCQQLSNFLSGLAFDQHPLLVPYVPKMNVVIARASDQLQTLKNQPVTPSGDAKPYKAIQELFDALKQKESEQKQDNAPAPKKKQSRLERFLNCISPSSQVI